MKALLIVDLQNDFCPGGALPAPDGDKIVPLVNDLIRKFDLTVASKDWHPQETVHFEKWPAHCVKETEGSEFHPELEKDRIQEVFLKGMNDKDDGYSAFEATNMNLKNYLRRKDVDELYICGLTTEYCVKTTALDAANSGLKTFVIEDAIKGVEQTQGDAQKAIEEMKNEGVNMIDSARLFNKIS